MPLVVIAASVLWLLLTSCSSTPHNITEKYYLIVPNAKSPYWEEVVQGLNRAARELKVSVSLMGPDTYNSQEQRDIFHKIAASKPAGILVSVADPKLLTPEIDAAITAGIPVITVDSDAPESKRLLFVGTNNYEAGQMGARMAAKQLNGKGNVVAFLTRGQENMEERLSGYRKIFEAYPQIKIVEVVDIKGDPRIAFDRANEILDKRKPEVDAFVSMEGQSAKEVAEVLRRHKPMTKVVIAMDTLAPTLEGIEQGLITATFAQKPFTMGYTSLRTIADLHLYKLANLQNDFRRNPHSPLPAFIDTGAALIDKSSLAAYRAGRVEIATEKGSPPGS